MIWNDILASGNGHLAAAWLEAVTLERFFGEVKLARKMLYRAINSTSDHPFMVNEILRSRLHSKKAWLFLGDVKCWDTQAALKKLCGAF